MNISIDATHIWSHNRLNWLLLSLFQQVRPQTLDHDFEVKSLVVEFLVKLLVALVCHPFIRVDLLQPFKLLRLLHCVVLKDSNPIPHLLLHEHVVLDAALEHLCSLAAFFSNPASIALFIQVGKCHLVDVQQDVIHRLKRVVDDSCLLIEVQGAD